MKRKPAAKARLVLYVTPAEIQAMKERADLNGLRTAQRWALSILVRELVIHGTGVSR